MYEMKTNERVKRILEHKEADRCPIMDDPWRSTLTRWAKEGMPENISYQDYFNIDKVFGYNPDNSPRFPVRTIEETEEYIINTTGFGVTKKNWKKRGGVPEYLDFTVIDPDIWKKAKETMRPSKDRIDWKRFKDNYKNWKEEGRWLKFVLYFGYDVTHSHMVGTERLLIAMLEQPEWCIDMFNHELDVSIGLYELMEQAGYVFDEFMWYDDMGYKGKQFFSLDMYRRLLKPVHQRAIDYAHKKGVKAYLHSCGNVNSFIPELVEMGLDVLNPLEVKAGMDPVALKNKFGSKLAFHGGLNAVLMEKAGEPLWTAMKQTIPAMKKNGGYIIGSDHSIPDNVSLKDMKELIRLAKELGKY